MLKIIITKALKKMPRIALIKLQYIFKKNKRINKILEKVRLEKFVNITDIENINVEKMPICVIDTGLWGYHIFNICFLHNMLSNIIYCLEKGYRPVVLFKDSESKVNLWEQFLIQPYENIYPLKDLEGYIKCDKKHSAFEFPMITTQESIIKYSKIYKAFVVLNQATKKYIDDEYLNILKGKRTLGVLCRGTDYTDIKPAGHPIQPNVYEVIELVEKKMSELNYNYIYLATEEEAIFEKFDKLFHGKVLVNKRNYFDKKYYELKKEMGIDVRINHVHFSRDNDAFWTSLEYLSSIMLLSKCDALIAGNCGGSKAALYLNGGKYEYWHIFDLGLY